jgi:primosomal protein N' (replication factor Y)
LLTQVAGRAGRGDVEGEVFVQAFTPFHPAIQYARRHDFVGFYDQEIEFREQLKYPPAARVALLTLKGRNEEKVQFSAEHLRKALDKLVGGGAEKGKGGKGVEENAMLFGMESSTPSTDKATQAAVAPVYFRDLIIAGPAPAPLLRAETFYRYQIMLRTKAMSRLSHALAGIVQELELPDDITLTVDIDPANLS